ncbi:MAG: hypothetical protein AB7K24_00690 [Gemmataceae bacterium]
MIQTCSRCSRVNPVGACYCYFDGAALMGASQAGANLPVGAQPFPTPFVFPTGKTCRNFDQLALACQENWQSASSALGDLERFLGSIGRSDLALAAREAGRGPDRERGVDDFLARLPGHAVQPPRLVVEPTEINLGQLKVGEDRTFDLHLRNQGMRLVHGSIQVDDALWLAVGPGRGGAQKLFQFGSELVLQVRVRGKHLRASHKPLTARLVISSNAGDVVINVKAELPVKSFSEGVLAGARSPRQVAERAKSNPKEAARLFEQGVVARWYRDNGWTYPVQGASASGLAAVQQFFEALGLTPAPKVDLTTRSLSLQGLPGGKANATIELRTNEKRPVWAQATSDQPWLEVGKSRLDGRVASIPVVVRKLPDAAGQTLRATLKVRANGNQRFEVPVTLAVGGQVSEVSQPAGETWLFRVHRSRPGCAGARLIVGICFPARPWRPRSWL